MSIPPELSARIKLVPNFPETQYFKEIFEKKQIVLHHTASGPGVDGDINWWIKTPEKVATCVIIARDGIIHQCFSSKYWAYHLGLQTANNLDIAHKTIGIEIDSWGQLTLKNGKYYSYTGAEISKENVVKYDKPHRGFKYYEKYTDAQIKSVKMLLEFWCNTYKIPKNYILSIWDLSKAALRLVPGIFTHVSYRADKNDCAPQKELIDMLKSLN